MKSIVVGIDFQNQSYAAMKFAVNFAKKVGANLELVFVNKFDRSKDIFQRPKSKIKEEATSRFVQLIDKYTDILSKDRFDYKIRTGTVVDELDREVRENNSEMIVIGTQGRAGFKLFSSSKAFKVVSNASVPVVTIKDGATIESNIRKILVPIDATLESRQKIPYTVKIARIYNAEIHMLALFHTKVDAITENIVSYSKQAAEYLESNAVNFVVKSVETSNVVKTTIDYSEEIDADVISSMTIQLSSASTLWKGSFAQQLIDRSHIPVINIQPKELIKTLSR
jgi:nucleotide-binding universal stress UspA family protein